MLIALVMQTYAQTVDPYVAKEISAEAIRTKKSDVGRPLPLAGHWNRGYYKDGFSPAYQMHLIAQGHYLLPWFLLPDIHTPVSSKTIDYFEPSLKQACSLRLPISFISTQWEAPLTDNQAYASLPKDTNPNVVEADGSIKPVVSPFGPIGLWEDVGGKWTSSPIMRKLEEWYPTPPKVFFVSNNEHPKLRWTDVESDARYLNTYGRGKSDDFKRKVIAEGWRERYHALQRGMLDRLINPSWKRNMVFIGFEAFGPSFFGRWSGWKNYSSYVPGRIDANPTYWDGGSVPFYVNSKNEETDYTVWSPQVEAMNWVFMLKEAYQVNPDYWFEISTWDGDEGKVSKRLVYKNRGQTYSPDRYKGMVQFGIWLLKPRLVREYRSAAETLSGADAYFQQVIKAVDVVHNNPVLRNFWRNGRLVPNKAHNHPYQVDIPDEYKNIDRWFLLDTNLDPPRPWKLTTELPIFTLAQVMGQAPNRQWLIYTHSPLGLKRQVRINIPDYASVNVDVPVAGAFYLISEGSDRVMAVDTR